jgi:hypothetical protein
MTVRLDHLVIAARDLAEGAAWLEAQLGVSLAGGGRHETMGTHNRLLSLGPGRYLELIAIDPDGATPSRPRWFDLDSAAMRARLERGPALVTWAIRSDDIEATSGQLGETEILPMARGPYRWRITVPADGTLGHAGARPTVLQWETEHPTVALPDAGCRLGKILLAHPEAPGMLARLRDAGLAADDPVEARPGAPHALAAYIRTPRGIVEIRG